MSLLSLTMMPNSSEATRAFLGVTTGPQVAVAAVKPSNNPQSPQAQKDGMLSFRRLKRDSTVLQEMEAGVEEAGERGSLSLRLVELGMELRKVKYGSNKGFHGTFSL